LTAVHPKALFHGMVSDERATKDKPGVISILTRKPTFRVSDEEFRELMKADFFDQPDLERAPPAQPGS